MTAQNTSRKVQSSTLKSCSETQGKKPSWK